ncbi:MAG: sialidase family protein [Solirubrobacteraceae bacterium]
MIVDVHREAAVTIAASLIAILAGAPVAPANAAVRCPTKDTGVVNVSSETGTSEGEEPLSVNPTHPQDMTTVANVYQPVPPLSITEDPLYGGGGVQDTRVYTTRDGGCHWLTRKLDQGGLGRVSVPLSGGADAPEFSDALNVLSTDADSAWDRHGNAYFEAGDAHGAAHDGMEVEVVWHSRDAGLTWAPKRGYVAFNATTGQKSELDRPWLAVDNSGGPHDGRLYTTTETTPFVDIPPQVNLKYSNDHGRTWSPEVRVDNGTYETQWNPRARPTVGAGGIVYVVYDRGPVTDTPLAGYSGPIDLVVARSSDGGRTFRRFVVDSRVERVMSPNEALPSYTEMISAIAADPRHRGHLAVAWPQSLGPDNSRIILRYSFDGGIHWSRRIDVADDPARRDDQHDHVTLAWQGNGRLFVGWRDRRCCGGGWSDDYQQWVRVLNPKRRGLRPGRTVRFSEGPLLPTNPGRSDGEPDEFQGLVATRLGVALTWSQLQPDGLDHLEFRRIALSAFAAPAHRRAR